jgi:hypothetical protein
VPISSFVYRIFSLIDRLAFAPVTGADDADDAVAPGESHREMRAETLPKQ